MTSKIAKRVYVVWQTIFGVPAAFIIIRALYRMATTHADMGGPLVATAYAFLPFCIMILIGLVASIPSAWYFGRKQ